MSPLSSHPGPFACVVCGESFFERPFLERHWRATLHHPKVAQAQALDRARAGMSAEPGPEPTRAQMLRLIDV
jgi:hypothetical protein